MSNEIISLQQARIRIPVCCHVVVENIQTHEDSEKNNDLLAYIQYSETELSSHIQMADTHVQTLTDEQLAKKASQDITAFETLVERYEQPLLRYIRRISSFETEEAEEILQEVFVKAWKNLNDFDGNLKFSSWIYRITHNQTISEFRKIKSRGKDQQVKWDPEVIEQLSDNVDLPGEINARIDTEKIREILTLIPVKYREALVLRFLEEKSYEEMSDILRVPIGTAGTLVNRAKKMFREKAQQQKIFDE